MAVSCMADSLIAYRASQIADGGEAVPRVSAFGYRIDVTVDAVRRGVEHAIAGCWCGWIDISPRAAINISR